VNSIDTMQATRGTLQHLRVPKGRSGISLFLRFQHSADDTERGHVLHVRSAVSNRRLRGGPIAMDGVELTLLGAGWRIDRTALFVQIEIDVLIYEG
jgi:hypothetical protein